MVFAVGCPGTVTNTRCKECSGQILDKVHGITLRYGGSSADKWYFHKRFCFPRFRERINLIDIDQMNARVKVVVK